MRHITTSEMYKGHTMDIRTLAENRVRFVAVDRALDGKGWEAFSHDRDGIGLTISSGHWRTRRDLVEALHRTFGPTVKINLGYWVDAATAEAGGLAPRIEA